MWTGNLPERMLRRVGGESGGKTPRALRPRAIAAIGEAAGRAGADDGAAEGPMDAELRSAAAAVLARLRARVPQLLTCTVP